MKQGRFRADRDIFDVPLSKKAKLVYLYICRCSNQDGHSFPSIPNIAWACSISESSVHSAIRELKEAHWLSNETRTRANGSQSSNLYRIAIVCKGWFHAPDDLFDVRTSSNAKLVYLYLCRMADADASSYPARKLIMKNCDMKSTTLKRAMKELVESQLIAKDARYRENGGQSSNLYQVNAPKVQPKQTKLVLIEGGKKEQPKHNSLSALHSSYYWTGGLSIITPLEGTATLGTIKNQKENTDMVLSNLVRYKAQLRAPP